MALTEFKIDLLPASDETSSMDTTHLHSFEALMEELLDPAASNVRINLYEDDMNYGSDDLKKDLKEVLPAGFDLSSSGYTVKVRKKFTGPGKPRKQEKEFKDPLKRDFEKMLKEEKRGKPKLKVLRSEAIANLMTALRSLTAAEKIGD